MSSDGGAHISYLWGYNKQYPIAKIENASNQTIATALNISLATLLNYDESNISIINTLRSLLSSAKVTTFTYDPMVGIKTVTDPKGYKITYEYDNFGRLKYVKDMEGHVLSENQYRYRND